MLKRCAAVLGFILCVFAAIPAEALILRGGGPISISLPSLDSISLSSTSFVPTSTAVFGTFTVTVSSGSFGGTLVLGGADAAKFTLVSLGGGQWTIQPAMSLGAGTYSITATATGSYANSPKTSPPFTSFAGTITASAASPSGTIIAAPSGTITDGQGNTWAFGAAWTPTSGYAGGYYVTKNGVTLNQVGAAATALWNLGDTTISVTTGLSITPGMAIYDGSLAAITYIATVSSYNSATGVVTLSNGALSASNGSTDALAFGQNTWALSLLYLNDVVYLQDPSNRWMAYSDQTSPVQLFNNIFGDPRNFSPAISASGTVNSTALAPTAIPSDPSWP